MKFSQISLTTFLAIVCACASTTPQTQKDAPNGSGSTDVQASTASSTVAHAKVIALSDFHGWLLPLEPKGYNKFFGGIAYLGGMLKGYEKLTPENSLILDNGDMFTGPTESTVLRGEPVIQAYNILGVDAANVANHEFDYGLEILKARASEANFPFVSANITQVGLETSPTFLKPWEIFEREGIKFGVLGLSYEKTPETTLATHVQGLEFGPYEQALKKHVPELKKAGADVIIVLFHDATDEVVRVLEKTTVDGIDIVIAGQNHRKETRKVGNTMIINPGPFGRSYVRFDVKMAKATRKVLPINFELVDVTGEVGNPSFPPNAELSAIADSARQKVKELTGEVVGQLARPLPQGRFSDSPVGHLVADAWLAAFPQADFAICNHGALRQGLGKGDVTFGDIVSMMPFENNLFIVTLTGKQLKSQLEIDGPVVAGLTWKYKETKKGRKLIRAVDNKGRKIVDARTYSVIINDFMYLGGDGYQFKDLDATPQDTGLSLREPIIRALRKAKSEGRAISPAKGARATRSR